MFPTVVSMIGDNGIEIAIFGNPDALFFKQKTSSPLNSKTCGGCGFVEIYAEDFRHLFQVYLEMKN